ncbi:uncharacterized protein LOC107424309 [Ziziphus jujuba]|uniref:Uncharacterized protein LOC107424309 n=1 Tax=Ziziphus jujuba TaxID=326968 RepID=A0A6P6GFM2_ZIZJJ|nr:uncharacterized protein LOC107424309 [Ziziphus jujuba]XP_024932505.2 uncharacterized protein LOC107424309 [Ziziphus jujuba]
MEANICDVNHLDADVLLPPRKRLLAGLKKQNSDGDSTSQPSLVPAASSPASSSSASASVFASSLSPSSSEFNNRLNNLLSSHSANLSPEEIVDASRIAASAAAKAAETARAAAEEKAAIAAKAVAAAKSALDLVASFSEEGASKDRYTRKNKLKKHVPVQLLYKKYQPIENCKKDEELARKLHRAINSSPRTCKNSSSSDLRGHKHKKPKISSTSERTRSNGDMVLEQNRTSACNGHAVAGEVDDSEGTIRESYKNKADEKACRYDKAGQLEMDYGEAESSQTNEKTWDDISTSGKKRGRVKLKKLPLSICTFRDQANPKEEADTRSMPLADMNMGNPTGGNMPLFTMDPSSEVVRPIEATSVWKCQQFNAPACVKQNKVMQS